MKKVVISLFMVFVMISLVACGDSFEQGVKDGMSDTSQESEEPESQEPEETEQESPAETGSETATSQESQEFTIEYDNLQMVFLALQRDMTPADLESLIGEKELSYTADEHNSSSGNAMNYRIAFEESVAAQNNPEPGDYIEVEFGGDNLDDFKLAHYVNENDVSYSALLYDHGTWYDFRDANAEDYGGYYVVDSISGKGGITVKYSNGNETETGYIPCASGEEAIQKITERIPE